MLLKELLRIYADEDQHNKITMKELTVNVPLDYNITDTYVNGKLFIDELELRKNARKLYYIINDIRNEFNSPITINRGYSTPEHNKEIGGATYSKHIMFAAFDASDKEHKLYYWLLDNNEAMAKKYNVWVEPVKFTPTRCHVQILPYGSWVDNESRIIPM